MGGRGVSRATAKNHYLQLASERRFVSCTLFHILHTSHPPTTLANDHSTSCSIKGAFFRLFVCNIIRRFVILLEGASRPPLSPLKTSTALDGQNTTPAGSIFIIF
jgi:hypothetical protein